MGCVFGRGGGGGGGGRGVAWASRPHAVPPLWAATAETGVGVVLACDHGSGWCSCGWAGRWSGQGTLTLGKSKDVYVGGMMRGKFHGTGTLTYGKGGFYEGGWKVGPPP